MLYIIGAGLSISLTERGKTFALNSDEIWLDVYTVIDPEAKKLLEKQLGREINIAERSHLESNFLLEKAKEKNICLITLGDPFFATTHSTLYLEALEKGIPVKVEHNSSILNVVGKTGLNPYRFGEVITLPRWTEQYKPTSAFDRLKKNLQNQLNTLMLIDISISPLSPIESFETIKHIERALNAEVLSNKDFFIISRAGRDDELILYGSIDLLKNLSAKIKQPYTLIIPADIRGFEEDAIKFWKEYTKILAKEKP